MNISHRRSNYRLLGLVGNGQFGRVYCGVHRKTGQLVAIKYLHRHSLPTHAFLRELHCLLSLAHPNIVACHAVEHSRDGRRLVLEYCAGGTLRSHMLSPLSPKDIFDLMTDVLTGLAHAHRQGIVHCDVKPENILLQYKRGRWRAKISDFGIAKLIQDQPPHKGLGQTGSPAYMAPERFYCQYSPSADVYAVGIMLFELLVGRRPFSGTPTALQSAHLNQPVPKAQELIAPLNAIITKALEKLPARRYPSATEMLADFQTLGSQLPTTVSPQTPIAYSPYTGAPAHSLSEPAGHLKEWLRPASTQVIMAQGSQVAVLPPPAQELPQGGQTLTHPQRLNGPIQGIYPSSTGLMISTEQGLWYGADPQQLAPLAHWPAPSIAAVSPRQRWAATVGTALQQLTILPLSPTARAAPIKRPLSPDLQLSQILAIDNGHLMLVGHTNTGETTGTQLQLWNRHGMYLTSLNLGIKLHSLTPMHQRHHWMAIDAQVPRTVIFLTLKPLKLHRITLEICPKLMLDLPWGYLFCNEAGHMVLLDRDLYPIGGIKGPPNVSAIAAISTHTLTVATWNKAAVAGAIHHLDLQTFDLDMIF